MNAYRNSSELPASRRLKAFLGSILRRLRPGLAKRVREKPFSGDWGTAGKLIRNADLADAVEAGEPGDHRTLQRFHQDFWSSTAAEADFLIHWERDRFTETGEENHPTRWFQIVAEG